MNLDVGMKAPALGLEGLHGPFRLSDLEGRKVLLSFLRNAKCAVCNLWVHETAKTAADWRDRGLEVVAVFEAPLENLRAQFEGRDVPFAILADPDGRAHDAFGSRVDRARVEQVVASGSGEAALARAAAAGFVPTTEEGSNFFRIPAELLIDEHGVIRAIHSADSVVDHMPKERIQTFLELVQV